MLNNYIFCTLFCFVLVGCTPSNSNTYKPKMITEMYNGCAASIAQEYFNRKQAIGADKLQALCNCSVSYVMENSSEKDFLQDMANRNYSTLTKAAEACKNQKEAL